MKRKVVFIDTRATSEILMKLSALGYETVTLPSFDRLGEAVGSHTDMLLLRVGDAIFSHADYVQRAPHVFDALYECGFKKIYLTDDDVRPEYPYDARLNVLIMGRVSFCKTDTVSKCVLEYLKSEGYRVINTKQGYPACCVLKLSDTLAIPADRGMASILEKEGIEVILIENGGIDLPPYEYGFIGGCAGMIGGKVYFTGCFDNHPSKAIIEKTIEKAKITPVYLTRTRPIDVGGLLFAE